MIDMQDIARRYLLAADFHGLSESHRHVIYGSDLWRLASKR